MMERQGNQETAVVWAGGQGWRGDVPRKGHVSYALSKDDSEIQGKMSQT